jgi:hypothetical protein
LNDVPLRERAKRVLDRRERLTLSDPLS